jgi:hypothetical protein
MASVLRTPVSTGRQRCPCANVAGVCAARRASIRARSEVAQNTLAVQTTASGRSERGTVGRQWVGQRQLGARSHRRKADHQVEPPDSRRPRSAVVDPKQKFCRPISAPERSHSPLYMSGNRQPAACCPFDGWLGRHGGGTRRAFMRARTRLVRGARVARALDARRPRPWRLSSSLRPSG